MTDEELTGSIEFREAKRRLEWCETYIKALGHTMAIAHSARVPGERIQALKAELAKARAYERQLAQQARKGLIHSRKRPKKRNTTGQAFVYLDECGPHVPKVRDKDYQAFALAAVIVKEEDLERFNELWSRWKTLTWGDDSRIIHEPEVRKGTHNWYFKGDEGTRQLAEERLTKTIASMPFKAIAVVVRRRAYIELCQEGGLDDSLPASVYHMALDLLCERIVMALEEEFDASQGILVAEARGSKEDARLQHEFVRLHLDGTSYILDAWFRQQLSPSIKFSRKAENIPGLQVTDLLARPCGDKVLNPTSTPARWPEFRDKLVQTKKTLHSPLGIKIVPWDDKYNEIWLP